MKNVLIEEWERKRFGERRNMVYLRNRERVGCLEGGEVLKSEEVRVVEIDVLIFEMLSE